MRDLLEEEDVQFAQQCALNVNVKVRRQEQFSQQANVEKNGVGDRHECQVSVDAVLSHLNENDQREKIAHSADAEQNRIRVQFDLTCDVFSLRTVDRHCCCS
jgi:hypothetical protein